MTIQDINIHRHILHHSYTPMYVHIICTFIFCNVKTKECVLYLGVCMHQLKMGEQWVVMACHCHPSCSTSLSSVQGRQHNLQNVISIYNKQVISYELTVGLGNWNWLRGEFSLFGFWETNSEFFCSSSSFGLFPTKVVIKMQCGNQQPNNDMSIAYTNDTIIALDTLHICHSMRMPIAQGQSD